uniref:Glucan endo-1,3-beta-glucosidase 8 n=1 Tax=Aegilops tauschii TaxID=37682 RepID=R7WEB0_AEGTA
MAAVNLGAWLCALLAAVAAVLPAADALGMNWGTQATHPLSPRIVVQMLRDNGIKKVKLFDADQGTLNALAGTDIEVMVAIPNNLLDIMNDKDNARDWVRHNVSRYHFDGGVNIKYVAVGNEPFLASYNGTFDKVTFPALQNIQNALNDAGFSEIKATVPLNADVYNSPANNQVPSAGRFRTDVAPLMTQMVQFLANNSAPFTVNIYPYLSLYLSEDFPVDFAYMEVYLFGLLDEDVKSVAPGAFERHWGVLRFDGQPKFPMDLTGNGQNTMLVPAKGVQYLPRTWCVYNPNAEDKSKLVENVNYACTFADCTALGLGSTCYGMDANGNASYAFNMYFQVQNQKDEACDFQALAVPTQTDPSTAACSFPIQIAAASSTSSGHRRARAGPLGAAALLVLLALVQLLMSQ